MMINQKHKIINQIIVTLFILYDFMHCYLRAKSLDYEWPITNYEFLSFKRLFVSSCSHYVIIVTTKQKSQKNAAFQQRKFDKK